MRDFLCADQQYPLKSVLGNCHSIYGIKVVVEQSV